ncbi:MAG TPA: histidine kinase N-terminal 7TM domain-containing protein [Polyangia bacterium]|nr:histidine kinase N-terminal 7TM domain-containing protein [Polyangia bacterium]
MRVWQLPLLASFAVSLATAFFAWRRRSKTPAARSFVALPLCHAAWTALAIATLSTTSLDIKLFISGAEWLAGLAMIGAGLWFASEYVGRGFRLETWGWFLLAPLPLVLMLLGEPFHHRLHPEAWVRITPPPSSLEYTFGWAEIALMAYGGVLALAAGGMVLTRLARARLHELRDMTVVMIGLALPPVLGMLSLVLGLRWFYQRDTTPIVFGLADLVVAVGLFRRHAFDLPPLALEAVVDGLADGVAICDTSGRIVDLNPALERILRIPSATLLGASAAAVFAEWPPLVEVCTGRRLHDEITVDPTSGKIRHGSNRSSLQWLDLLGAPVRDWRGRPLGIAAVLRDVTARKRASDRRFQAVFDHTFELIALLAPDGTVLEVNETALSFGGVTRDSVQGRPLWEAPWWAHSPTARTDLRAALHAMTRGELMRFEATHLRCDSRTRYFDFSLTAVANDEGDVEYLIAEARDVTDMLRAEKENAMLADRLAHARRLESIGRMAAAIAHDFNNVLVAVMGSAAMAKTAVPSGSPAAQALEVIERAGDSAAQLIRQLLAFGRPQSAAAAPIDVGVVIGRAAALVRPAIGADVTVLVDNSAPLWPVRIDPGQLEQVLLNLAVNARDAMPNGGTLLISAQNFTLDQSRRFQGTELRPGRYVLIRIGDTGLGMSDAVIDRAFEPFFTTKPAGKGSGLGLSVAYGIIHGHGGYLEVKSSPGAGTEMRIYLPPCIPTDLPADPPLACAESPANGVARSATRPRAPACVVIIEDEHAVRAFLHSELTSVGYEVHAFADGAAAEAAAASLPNPPDLLITDFVLPDASGLEVADGLRRSWPALKVLFLSAFAATARRAPDRPDVHFLSKPVDAKKLTQTVETLLAAV